MVDFQPRFFVPKGSPSGIHGDDRRNQLGTPVNPNLSEWWTGELRSPFFQVSPLWLFHLSLQKPQKTSTSPLKNSFVEMGISR